MSEQSYHVHTYKVSELVEINLNAIDEKGAREKALEMVEMFKFKKSKLDCKHIAIVFKGVQAEDIKDE